MDMENEDGYPSCYINMEGLGEDTEVKMLSGK